jgi:hypothetical protein
MMVSFFFTGHVCIQNKNAFPPLLQTTKFIYEGWLALVSTVVIVAT